MKQRVQHPEVHEQKHQGTYWWFCRYYQDEIQPDGSVKTNRPFLWIGPSRDKAKPMNRQQARLERDKFLAGLTAPAMAMPVTTAPAAAVQAHAPVVNDPNQIIFGELAKVWRTEYVEKIAAGKHLCAKPTRAKYINHLENHILPRWEKTRLGDLRARVVLDWLQTEAQSWHMMADLRGVISGIITKAIEWEIIPETFANPMRRVKLPKKVLKREKRILTEGETAAVLANIEEEGTLLICETCLDTGTRISEVTGLKIKHVDLQKGTIQIAQRNWRGDIDVPKTEKSKRILALGELTPRYKAWIAGLKHRRPEAWVFPGDDPKQPRWDSGVRQCLKRAARAVRAADAPPNDRGLDFPGFGPHSLRRANITWRQEFGSSLEASIIAGHSGTKMTAEYTLVPLKRQEELTRGLQAKRAKVRTEQDEVPGGADS